MAELEVPLYVTVGFGTRDGFPDVAVSVNVSFSKGPAEIPVTVMDLLVEFSNTLWFEITSNAGGSFTGFTVTAIVATLEVAPSLSFTVYLAVATP